MEIHATSSGADLEKLTAQTVKALRGAQRTIGKDIAKVARKTILDDVRKSRRGGLSMSGMRTKLGAKTVVEPHGDRVDVTLSARPAGPWAIVEFGSVPHVIRARRAEALFIAGVGTFEEVHHPGTRAMRFWDGAEPALDRAVAPAIEDAYDEAFEEN